MTLTPWSLRPEALRNFFRIFRRALEQKFHNSRLQMYPATCIHLSLRRVKLAVCRREGKPPFFLHLWAAWLAYEAFLRPTWWPRLTINALPHTLVLSDKLLGASRLTVLNSFISKWCLTVIILAQKNGEAVIHTETKDGLAHYFTQGYKPRYKPTCHFRYICPCLYVTAPGVPRFCRSTSSFLFPIATPHPHTSSIPSDEAFYSHSSITISRQHVQTSARCRAVSANQRLCSSHAVSRILAWQGV